MFVAHLLRPLPFCLFTLLILSPSAYTWAADMSTQAANPQGQVTKDKDQECGAPALIRDKDGKITVVKGKEGRCYSHLAANGEDGFCVAGQKSFACNVEGMYGCLTGMGTVGACTTIDTGGGVCQCACQ